MNISFIVILGLPVLYMTGSLRKIVSGTKIGGKSFVLYFLCAAALWLLPALNITQNVSVNISGVFLCAAPAVYLAVKKSYDFKFFIICAAIALISVTVSFLQSSYNLPYLAYLISVIVSVTAIFCFKESAPVYVPVFIGVYCLFYNTIQIFLSTYYQNIFFQAIEMASIGIAISLFFAYFAAKPKGRHAARNNSSKKDMLT